MADTVEIDVLFPDPIIADVIVDRMGPAGIGVPVGGTTGQHLAKASNTDFDFDWVAADQDPDWANVQNKPGYATHSADATHDGYLLQADWVTFNAKQAALGFTPENVANKDTDGTLSANSDTKYASQKATKTYVDGKTSSGANPSATVSGSAVNGSAVTFMRSDAAPALANTAVTAASYGAANKSPSFTVDAQGRLTAAADVTITPSAIGAVPTTTTVNGHALSSNVTVTDSDLGATTVGDAIFKLTNPSAITFLKINADNSVTARSAANFRSDIGAGTGSGDALTSNPLSQFASTTSAQLAGVLSDETGTGVAVFGTNPTLTGATVDSGSLVMQGSQSAAAWTTSGIRLKGISGTLTDTSSSGTVAAAYTNKLGGNTIAASNAATFTNYISSYFSEPVAGTNVTLTNKWGLGADSLYIGTSNPVKVTSAGVLTATSPVLTTPDLGTPSALVGTSITGTGSSFTAGHAIDAASLSISGQTGLLSFTGLASTNRIKTVRDAADTILELGGSYTPTGTWTSLPLTTPKVTTAIQDANGNSMLAFTATASAVDGFTFTNAATASPAMISMSATGSDSNVSLGIVAKGTGVVRVGSTGNFGINVDPTNNTITFNRASDAIAIFTYNTSTNILTVGNFFATNPTVNNTGLFRWSSTSTANSSSYDTAIARNGAGVAEINNATSGQWGSLKLGTRDSGTNTVTNGLTVGHQSTGTPAAGLGSGILFNINDSTTADVNAGQFYVKWTDATHATRTSQAGVALVNNAGVLTDALVIKPTGVGILGTTTNDNATAGNVGEYVSSSVVVGSATALTTATPKTVTSISLTAGDWDVTAIGALTGASTGTEFDIAIGTTTNSLTGTVLGDTRCQTPTVSLTGADASLMIPAVRVSISSTTTYYLIVQETFTVGSPSAYGRISARRVR